MTADTQGQRMPSITLNTDGFSRMCRRVLVEDDNDLAKRIGVSPATVSRVKAGKLSPSNRFIAGSLQTFGHSWFLELFKVVED